MRNWITIIAACLFASSVGIAANSPDVEKEARRQIASGMRLPLNVAFSSMNICADSRIPWGWIKTDDSWNPTVCGKPTSIGYNVVTITEYSRMPIGSTLSVCSDAPTPRGWVEISHGWMPTRCGHPTSIVNNTKIIQRIS